ncbi:hypothetical protein V1478_000998 [Vespula squamosa]|uniref:Uncharacterized protein n=1 Tax=Vespula squamosa TaxID=30214 RepID=A0ABD2C731_VESSQ
MQCRIKFSLLSNVVIYDLTTEYYSIFKKLVILIDCSKIRKVPKRLISICQIFKLDAAFLFVIVDIDARCYKDLQYGGFY